MFIYYVNAELTVTNKRANVALIMSWCRGGLRVHRREGRLPRVLNVVFDGEFPPHDPSSTVKITWDKLVVSTPAVVGHSCICAYKQNFTAK
jgi:hypothetical protein